MCGLCKRDIAGLPCEVIVQARHPDPGTEAGIAYEVLCGRCADRVAGWIEEQKTA